MELMEILKKKTNTEVPAGPSGELQKFLRNGEKILRYYNDGPLGMIDHLEAIQQYSAHHTGQELYLRAEQYPLPGGRILSRNLVDKTKGHIVLALVSEDEIAGKSGDAVGHFIDGALYRGLLPSAKIILWRDGRIHRLPGIVVDEHYRLWIDGKGKEVQLYPLEKTLFLFYLRHKEGIPISRLREQKQALLDIYQKLSNQSEQSAIEHAINNLVDTKSNAVYEKLSRIKRVLISILGEAVASEYYISGQRGKTHRILLPRHLIQWKNNGDAENHTE